VKTAPKILLASSSPYRRELMDQLKIPYTHASPKTDEALLKKTYQGPLEKLPEYLARKKAESLLGENPDGITIGCDQIALLEGRALDKPGTAENAVQQLMSLQGKTHELYTALAVHSRGEWRLETHITTLHMKSLSEQQARDYVALDQPVDCAGAYKIEKNGSDLFEDVENFDPSAIVGLPLMNLVEILEDLGIDFPE